MDKTYNDLMSIVNRTKTIQGDDAPKITRRIRREEPIDEAVESDRVVKPAKDLDESKPSLFAGSDAITKYLANSKKKTTKTTAKKSENKESSEKEEKKGKKTTTKAPAKKTTAKKAPAKKETPKVEKPKVEKVEKPIPAKKVETPEIDLSNPENAQLYNALKGTLLAGGTDISEYIDNDKEETEGILKTLQEKRKAEKINEEITKEQQEYERLFTGSFYSEEEIKQGDQSSEEIEESHEETHEQENKENQEKPSRNIEDIAKDFEKIKVREEENE